MPSYGFAEEGKTNVDGVVYAWSPSQGRMVALAQMTPKFTQPAVSVSPQSLRWILRRSERIVAPTSGDPEQVCEFASSVEEVPGWSKATVKAFRQLDILPDGRLVACAANGDRVHWSWDGVSWTPYMQCPVWSWQGLCVVKGGTYAGRIIVGSTDAGIWYSDDGSAWVQTLAGVTVRALASTSDGAIYAGGTSGFGMRKSTDGGVTWNIVSAWTYGDIYQAIGTDGGTTIYAANNGGQARKSTNGGTSWTALSSNTDGWRGFLKSGSTLYAATGSGLKVSTDDGTTWGSYKTGMPLGVNGLVLRDATLYTAATTGSTVVWHTTDDGVTGLSDYLGASVSVSGGQLRFAEVGARRYKKLLEYPNINGRGIPSDGIVSDVVFSQTPVYVGSGTDSTYDVAIMGWHRDARNYLVAEVNNLTGSVYFRGAYLGSAFASSAAWLTTTQSMRLSVTWDGFAISLWGYDSTGQWAPVATYRVPNQTNGAMGSVDPLYWSFEGWNRCVGAYCSVASSVLKFNRVEFAPTGRVGIRDIGVVTYHTGEPVQDAHGRIYVTATVAPANLVGASLNAVHAAHCGVFLYDPRSRTLSSEIARIYTRHNSANGYPATRGNSPIKIVCNQIDGTWILLVSDWSDGGKAIRIVRQKASPLSGTSLVDATEILVNSPDSGTYAYDADLVYAGGLWRLVCTWGAVNGNNALITATTIDGLKTATPLVITSAGEGPRWSRIGGAWYINVNGVVRDKDGAAVSSFPRLDIDLQQTGIGTPHLTVIPVSTPGGTRYDLLSFDGTPYNGVASSLTNGALGVWSTQTISGSETFA